MSIKNRIQNGWSLLKDTVNRSEGTSIQKCLRAAFWMGGFVSICYWLHSWGLWQRPGTYIAQLFEIDIESRRWATPLLSLIVFCTLFSVATLVLWTNESLRKYLKTNSGSLRKWGLWGCVATTFVSMLILAYEIGSLGISRLSQSDVWSQIVVFAMVGVLLSWILYCLIRFWGQTPNGEKLAGPFKASGASSTVALFVACWFGYFCVYPALIDFTYARLVEAYKNTNVFVDALESDPFVERKGGTFPGFVLPKTEAEASKDENDLGSVYNVADNDSELLYRYLTYIGIVPRTTSLDDFRKNDQFGKDVPFLFQRHLIENAEFDSGQFEHLGTRLLDEQSSSLKLVVAMVDAMHAEPAITSDKTDSFVTALASSLAGSPATEKSWDEANGNDSEGTESTGGGTQRTECNASEAASGKAREAEPQQPSGTSDDGFGIHLLRPIGIPEGISDVTVISRLSDNKRQNQALSENEVEAESETHLELIEQVVEASANFANAEANADAKAKARVDLTLAKGRYIAWRFFSVPENEKLAKRMIEETLARTHSTPDVKTSRYLVSIVQGREQLGMLILALWLAVLLVIRTSNTLKLNKSEKWSRFVSRDAESRDPEGANALVASEFGLTSTQSADHTDENVETRFARIRRVNYEGRWMMRWIAQALPAIGFIGTVRGISAGLGSADSIVRAENMISQAAAINQVAGQLGVAFTTTLIALIFGLGLGLLERLEASGENRVLSRLETACVKDKANENGAGKDGD